MTSSRISNLQTFPLYLSHRGTGLQHHMPREKEERTKQTLVTALLSLVSTLTRTSVLTELSLFPSLMDGPPGLPQATCSKKTACRSYPYGKGKVAFSRGEGIPPLHCSRVRKSPCFHSGKKSEHICGVALQLPNSTSLQTQFLHWNDEIPLSSYSIVTKWIHKFSSFDFKLTAFCNQLRSIASNRNSSMKKHTTAKVQLLPFLMPPTDFTQKAALGKNLSLSMFSPRLCSLPIIGLNMSSSDDDRQENSECTEFLQNLIL